jgi:ankyrin repeat protein
MADESELEQLRPVDIDALLSKNIESEGNVACIQAILRYMADKPVTFFPWPLLLSHPDYVAFFLSCGASVDARNDHQFPLSHFAIRVDMTPQRLESLRLLLDAGMDVLACDEYGCTSWVYASQVADVFSPEFVSMTLMLMEKQPEFVNELSPPQLSRPEMEPVLELALSARHLPHLLSNVARLRFGSPLFFQVHTAYHLKIVRLLLPHVGPNALNFRQRTALFYVGNLHAAQELVKYGCSTAQQDDQSDTALLFALRTATSWPLVDFLLSWSPLGAKNAQGTTAATMSFQQLSDFLRKDTTRLDWHRKITKAKQAEYDRVKRCVEQNWHGHMMPRELIHLVCQFTL